MNCPDIASQCPENAGQSTGTGLARAYREAGTCPVPPPVPKYPADVPLAVPACQESRGQITWTDLDDEFRIAVLRQSRGWVNAWVAHRTRRPKSGSWRVAWSESEGRFAKSSEMQNMRARFPQLEPLAEAYLRSLLAPARAFAL
jgi:hypothetical protein